MLRIKAAVMELGCLEQGRLRKCTGDGWTGRVCFFGGAWCRALISGLFTITLLGMRVLVLLGPEDEAGEDPGGLFLPPCSGICCSV